MALNFQGDRAVGVLNDPKNTFNTDDLFRVYDGGILVAGGVSVDHGDFVSWDGTKWKLEADIKIARSDEVSQQSSNLAPNYTKTTYPANSYVMYDGVLYTNPNAIETAEDWNPEHWTQTTVAEMIAGAGGSTGYIQRNVTVGVKDGWHPVVDVPNRSVTVVSTSVGFDTTPWDIIIDNDCTDAIIILKFTNQSMQPSGIAITRVNGNPLTLYGTEGQLVTGDINDAGSGFEFEPRFNGIDGGYSCSEVLIHICGDIALLSFTVVV